MGSARRPTLLTNVGRYYRYGNDFDQVHDWEKEMALEALSQLEKKELNSNEGGGCCVM